MLLKKVRDSSFSAWQSRGSPLVGPFTATTVMSAGHSCTSHTQVAKWVLNGQKAQEQFLRLSPSLLLI